MEDLGFDEEVFCVLVYMCCKLDGVCIVGGKIGDGKIIIFVRCIEELYKECDGVIGIVLIEDLVEI